jgi:hypothetical protein
MSFVCDHCKKEFVKETSIEVHLCEPKRRTLAREEPVNRLGFQAFVHFYQTHQNGKIKTYQEFCASSYYKAFVKFGNYCISTRVINPSRYMDWLLKQQKKIDNWCSDRVYTEYLIWYLPTEAVDDALSRAIEQSIQWQEKTQSPAHDMLRYGNANALCYDITSGRLSPWAIYNCESGVSFLSQLSKEQVAMTWSYINSDTWQKKFQDSPKDQAYAQEILTRAGW